MSAVITAWFTGIATPCSLILMGAPTEMKMSDAFLLAITWNSLFMADMVPPRTVICP